MEKMKFKNILLKFHKLLLEKLDPNEVSLQLLAAGVLTSDEKQKIDKKPSQKEKSEELLMMLVTKGPRAYEEFVKALEKDHCFLACQLLKEGMCSAGQHEMVFVIISKYFVHYACINGWDFMHLHEPAKRLNRGNQLQLT